MSEKDFHTILGAIDALKRQQAENHAALLERITKLEAEKGTGDIDPGKAYSCEQAARHLGISRHTVWKRVKARLIPTIPQPAGSSLIRIRGKTLIALTAGESE